MSEANFQRMQNLKVDKFYSGVSQININTERAIAEQIDRGEFFSKQQQLFAKQKGDLEL